jgi:hypothetical protein
MKISKYRIGIAVLAACLAISHANAATELQCPARIAFEPVAVKDVPDGWRSAQDATALPVWGAEVSVGPPEQRIVLKPEVVSAKGRKTFKWRFDSAENEKGLWLSCVYGHAPVSLTRELPKGLVACAANEAELVKGAWSVKVSCH